MDNPGNRSQTTQILRTGLSSISLPLPSMKYFAAFLLLLAATDAQVPLLSTPAGPFGHLRSQEEAGKEKNLDHDRDETTKLLLLPGGLQGGGLRGAGISLPVVMSSVTRVWQQIS